MGLGLSGLRLGLGRRGGGAWTPLKLFSGGEVGTWLPIDLRSGHLFQDASGTTVAGASGDPVGRANDQTANGLNALQSVNTSYRPTLARMPLGGVRNLLDASEDFSLIPGEWNIVTATHTTGITDPLGGNTAIRVTPTGAQAYIQTSNNGASVSQIMMSAWMRSADGSPMTLHFRTAGVLGSAKTVTGTWQRFDSLISGTTLDFRIQNRTDTRAFEVAFCQVEDGTEATAYQRRITQYDVTEEGVDSAFYLKHDGVNDVITVQGVPADTYTVSWIDPAAVDAGQDANGDPTYFEGVSISGNYNLPTGNLSNVVILDRAMTGSEWARYYNSLAVDYYVDNTDGSDSDSGSSPFYPMQTLDAAEAAGSNGDTIALIGSHPAVTLVRRSVLGVEGAARLDARQDVSGLTWTQDGLTNTWEAEVTFRETPFHMGGATANSTHFMVWAGDTPLTWHVGGADIDANRTAVDGDAGSFTIHRQSSTAQDPRSDTAGSVYVVHVHMPNSATPAGQSVYVSDQSGVLQLSGARVEEMTIIGGYGKDSAQMAAEGATFDGPIPTLRNVTIPNVPAHAIVGPCRGAGTLTVSGRVVPGSTYAAYGRNLGGLVNLYTDTYRGETLTFDRIVAEGGGIAAVYGHDGATNQGYDAVVINELVITNCSKGVFFLGVDGLPFVGMTTIGDVQATNVDRLAEPSGDLLIEGGNVTLSTVAQQPATSGQSLIGSELPNQTFTLRGLTFEFGWDSGSYFSGNNSWVAGANMDTATIILDGCTDITSSPTAKGGLTRTGVQPHVEIRGGSVLADMLRFPTAPLPSSLVVEAGCTFGMGARTGPEILAKLDAEGVPHTISHDTTIIDRLGNVLSSPGW